MANPSITAFETKILNALADTDFDPMEEVIDEDSHDMLLDVIEQEIVLDNPKTVVALFQLQDRDEIAFDHQYLFQLGLYYGYPKWCERFLKCMKDRNMTFDWTESLAYPDRVFQEDETFGMIVNNSALYTPKFDYIFRQLVNEFGMPINGVVLEHGKPASAATHPLLLTLRYYSQNTNQWNAAIVDFLITKHIQWDAILQLEKTGKPSITVPLLYFFCVGVSAKEAHRDNQLYKEIREVNEKLLKLCLKNGGAKHVNTAVLQTYPLMWVIGSGNASLVKLLMDYGADVTESKTHAPDHIFARNFHLDPDEPIHQRKTMMTPNEFAALWDEDNMGQSNYVSIVQTMHDALKSRLKTEVSQKLNALLLASKRSEIDLPDDILVNIAQLSINDTRSMRKKLVDSIVAAKMTARDQMNKAAHQTSGGATKKKKYKEIE